MMLRRWASAWLYRHGVRWHAQNLDRDGRGSMWREGRCWLTWFVGDGDTGQGYRERLTIHPEWIIGGHLGPGLGLELGGGDSNREIKLSLGLPGAHVWLHVDGLPDAWMARLLPGRLHRWVDRQGQEHAVKRTEAREVRVAWHDGALWWALWTSPMEWSSRTPRWRDGHCAPVDWLLGRRRYTATTVGTRAAVIPLPEGVYPATLTFQDEAWRRPRWPWAHHRATTQIEIPGGVPVPGKARTVGIVERMRSMRWARRGTACRRR